MIDFLVFLALSIISFLYYSIAKRLGIIDLPSERGAHSNATLRGMGILFLAAICFFYIESEGSYSYFFIGTLLLGVVGFCDDRYSLSSKLRIAFYSFGIFLIVAELYFSGYVTWYLWLFLLPLGLGIVNAFNFMDGINGITGSYSLLFLLTAWWLNNQHNIIDPSIITFLISSVVIFLFFNFRQKALAFCGDVGSITIGAVIFFLVLILCFNLGPSYMLLLSLYGIDTGYTILYRISKRQNILEAHKEHFYQQLIHRVKWSHLKVTAMYVIVQLVVNVLVVYTVPFVYLSVILLIILITHYYRLKLGKGINFRAKKVVSS